MSFETFARTALKRADDDIDKAVPQFVRAISAANLIDDLARVYLSQIAAGPGQKADENHAATAGPAPKGSVKVRQYDVKQHRRRTPSEKLAAMTAARTSIEAVFEMQINGRAIGTIRIGELSALRRDLVDDATSKLMLGIEQARNAVLAELIQNYAVVPDEYARVRDVMDGRTLKRLIREADEEAPRRVSEAMRHASAVIDNRKLAS